MSRNQRKPVLLHNFADLGSKVDLSRDDFKLDGERDVYRSDGRVHTHNLLTILFSLPICYINAQRGSDAIMGWLPLR